ncbi:MAG TPA: CdaR family protein [Thermoanaerobaculia bacterium]|jgi:YbbR domain-containing protein
MARRRFFFRNLGLKILALAIAVAVWFALSGERRERISERSYRIPLSLVNIPFRTIVASPLPGAVDVRVRGPFTALRGLEPEKLEAVIDLLNATPGEKTYRLAPEDINVPPEVEVIALSPGEVRVLLDKVAEKLLPIVPALSGEVAPGSQVVDVSVEPKIARVMGPATALAKMTGIGTEPVSLANRAATFSATTTVLPDAPGVRVREGQVVNVTVRIGPAPTKTPTETAGAAAR